MKKVSAFFSKGGYQRQIRLTSLWIMIPLLLTSILVRFLLVGPVQNAYQRQHDKQVRAVVENINQQLSQMEVSLSVWGRYLQENIGPEALTTDDTDYQKIKSISQDLFYLDNSQTYVKSVQVYNFNGEVFRLASGGKYYISPDNERKVYNDFSIDNKRQYQWKMSDQGLIFTQNVDTLTKEAPQLFLVAVIDEEKLLNLFNNTKTPGGYSAIAFDDENRSLIGDTQAIDILKDLPQDNDNEVIRYQGDDISVTRVDFERLSQTWHFYSMVPLNTITEPVKDFSKSLIFISIFVLIITFILSQYFAKKQYKPFEETMTSMFGQEWNEREDLNFLKNKWQEMNIEQGKLQKIAVESTKSTKQSVLRRLSQGYYGYMQESELVELLEKNHWSLQAGSYQIYYIQLNDVIDGRKAKLGEDFMDFALENIVLEISKNHFEEIALLYEKEMTITIFAMGEKKSLYVQTLYAQLNKVLNRYVTVVESKEENKFKCLPTLVSKTNQRICYQTLTAENQWIETEEKGNFLAPRYPIYLESMIITALKNYRLDELQENTDQFIVEILKEDSRQFAFDHAIGRLYDTVSYQLNENGVSSIDYLDKVIVLERVKHILCPKRLSQFLYQEFLKPISMLWQEKITDSTHELMQEIALYIQKEFQNEQISLETVADEFHIDPVFLSKEFKRIKNINFIDYLTDIRIAEAKRLLLETDDKINVIADNIGYNPSYFNRLFKKITGVTPGQFRKSSA